MKVDTPGCQAKSKRSGKRCCNFVVGGKRVCRFHGGKSTGARTLEGKMRQKMASWKHGRFSKEAIEERQAFSKTLKSYKESLADFQL